MGRALCRRPPDLRNACCQSYLDARGSHLITQGSHFGAQGSHLATTGVPFVCIRVGFGCTWFVFGCTWFVFGCTGLVVGCMGIAFGCTGAAYIVNTSCMQYMEHLLHMAWDPRAEAPGSVGGNYGDHGPYYPPIKQLASRLQDIRHQTLYRFLDN